MNRSRIGARGRAALGAGVRFAAVAAALALGLATAPRAAADGGLAIGGSLLVDTSMLETTALSPGSAPGLSPGGYSQLTVNLANRDRRDAKVEGSAVVTLSYGGYADAALAALEQRVGASLAPALLTLASSNGAVVSIDLRKLYLALYTPLVDLSFGRQIINFGVGRLFSPIDAFSLPSLSDLNYARSGSDVVRADAAFGELSGAEAVATVTGGFDTVTSALKVYANVGGVDLAAVVLYRGASDELITGVDAKGDLVVGLYGEAVEHFSLSDGRRFFEGMAGADYSIGDALYLFAEYYYNGGAIAPGASLGSLPMGAIFANEHYLYAAARWTPTELAALQASIVYDLSANSFLPTLQAFYSVAQNASLIAYGRFMRGDVVAGGAWSGPDLQYGVQARVSF